MSTANNGELSLSSRRPDILFADGCKLYNADSDHCVNCKPTLCETIRCAYLSCLFAFLSILFVIYDISQCSHFAFTSNHTLSITVSTEGKYM